VERPDKDSSEAHNNQSEPCSFLLLTWVVRHKIYLIPHTDLHKRFLANAIFKDDDPFTRQLAPILSLLENFPAYQLAYDSNP
jgi:hypothetical protein